MSLIAAGIGAVSSLIGGRKAAKEQRRMIAEQNAYNHPSAIRARAEEAGFNPLLFVGPGVGTQTALAQPVMGQAIANAGLAIANGFSDWEAQRAQATALEKQNAELRKALETATLRPKVGGVWPAGATYVPDTPAGVDATVLTGRQTKVVGGNSDYTTPGAPALRWPKNVPPSQVPMVPQPLFTSYEVEGDIYNVPEGPEWDEMITGLAIVGRDLWDNALERGRIYADTRRMKDRVVNTRKLPAMGADWLPMRAPGWAQ